MHFIEKCKHGKIMAQCRCPSPDKTINIVSCSCVEDQTWPSLNSQLCDHCGKIYYDDVLNHIGHDFPLDCIKYLKHINFELNFKLDKAING